MYARTRILQRKIAMSADMMLIAGYFTVHIQISQQNIARKQSAHIFIQFRNAQCIFRKLHGTNLENIYSSRDMLPSTPLINAPAFSVEY